MVLINNMDVLSNDHLKKQGLSLVDIEDWSVKCGACKSLSLLHKGACTRSGERCHIEIMG